MWQRGSSFEKRKKRYPVKDGRTHCPTLSAIGLSHIKIGHIERVGLDEFAPRLDHVAHEAREDVVGVLALLDLHLKDGARIEVERGVPELARVHLAEALIALQRQPLAAG